MSPGRCAGSGIVFSRFLEVDINLGVIIGMGVVFMYAVLGGMKGITYTQVAQYWCIDFCLHGTSDLHLHTDHGSLDPRKWVSAPWWKAEQDYRSSTNLTRHLLTSASAPTRRAANRW